MNSERKVILFKAEATPGTDAAPTSAANAFQAIDFKWGKAGKATTDQFDYAAPYYGSRDVFNVAMQSDCSFDIPVIGAGLPLGTNYPAPLLDLYRACGHAAVMTAGTSVVLMPISTGEETGTLYANEDGFLRKMPFSRGSMKWMWAENKVPRCTVSLMGLYNAPSDTPMPVPSFPTIQKPVGFGNASTLITVGGFALKCMSADLDGGRSNAYRRLSGVEDVVPSDMKPTATLKFEMPNVAQKNFYAELEASLEQTLRIQHGAAAGNIFTVDAARAKLVDLDEVKDRTRIFMTAKFELLPTAAGLPYTLTLT